MSQFPRPPRIKPPTTPRQTPQVSFGQRPEAVTSGHQLDPNFALWIPCASNVGPRGFSHEYIEKGHGGMYDLHFHDRIIASGAGLVVFWMPGGKMETGDMLEFDCMKHCRANVQTAHLGDPADLWYALNECKKLGRKTAIYLGATMEWDKLSTADIEQKVMDEIAPYKGACDVVIIDCGCEAVEGDAYCIAHRVITKDLGMECWAETRALKGKYSAINGHTHLCVGSKWDSSGGAAGDQYHATDTGKTWILSEHADPTGAEARRYKNASGKVAVGISERHITATSLKAVIDP